MSSLFIPLLGEVRIDKIYSYHDFPLLFSLKNNYDDIYFVSYVEHTEDGESWMAVRLDEAELQSLEAGKVDIRTAFTKSKSAAVALIDLKDDGSTPNVSYILSSNAKLQEYLAQPGEYLNVGAKEVENNVVIGTYTQSSVVDSHSENNNVEIVFEDTRFNLTQAVYASYSNEQTASKESGNQISNIWADAI